MKIDCHEHTGLLIQIRLFHQGLGKHHPSAERELRNQNYTLHIEVEGQAMMSVKAKMSALQNQLNTYQMLVMYAKSENGVHL